MKCSKIRRLLPRYVDSELSPALHAEVRGHLSGCGACRTEEEQLRESMELLNAWGGIEPCLGYDTLTRRIADGAMSRRPSPVLGVQSWAAGVLAIISIAVGVTLGIRTPGSSPQPMPTEQQVASAIELHSFDDVMESSIVADIRSSKAEEQR